MTDETLTLPRPKARPRPKPPRAGVVGPLFKWELVRLARRGQDARARFILAVTLLFVLTAFTLVWFHNIDPRELFFGTSQVMSLAESAKFADRFAVTFVLAQIVVLSLLTPAYAAGGISEEKERKTFEFLLVSDLTSREILLGKFLGRLVFLLGVMVAGLPILAIAQLYGGVSLKFLLVCYLITAATVVMHAALSAAAAAAVDTYRGALFRGYGFVALHLIIGGVYPLLSPLAWVVLLFNLEADSPTAFWVLGVGYAVGELLVAVLAVFLGMMWVRRTRARMGAVRRPPRDDPSPYKPKTKAYHHDGRRREPEVVVLAKGEDAVLLGADDEASPDDGPVRMAAPLRAAEVRTVAPVAEEPPPRRKPKRRPVEFHHIPDEVANRPRVPSADPFLWKEQYVAGVKRTGDDDTIRGLLIAVGVAVGLCVGFFVLIGGTVALVGATTGSNNEAAEWMLLPAGGGGLFLYLLMVGSAAAMSVARERQRLTLESLLTIPVDRRRILWPKWAVSVKKAWWWGGAAALALPLGFLATDFYPAALPAAVFVAAAVPLTASYGLWLSVRCRSVSRAVLWLLPMVGGLALLPLAVRITFDRTEAIAGTAVLAVAALAAAAAAWMWWLAALRAFEREGR